MLQVAGRAIDFCFIIGKDRRLPIGMRSGRPASPALSRSELPRLGAEQQIPHFVRDGTLIFGMTDKCWAASACATVPYTRCVKPAYAVEMELKRFVGVTRLLVTTSNLHR